MDSNYAARLRPLAAPAQTPLLPQAARFLELPNQLSPDGIPALTPLVTRAELTANFFTVHLNQNYAFDGAPADSYEMIGGSDAFAQYGTLHRDYTATTDTLDVTVGILVQLEGVDTTIENQSSFGGLASEFVVFINDEIMSILDSELVADGLYLLHVARNRFGTSRAAHVTGDAVFILKQTALLKLQHPHFQKGNIAELKISMQSNGVASDLADVDSDEIEFEGLAFNLPAPSALTLDGISVNPGFDSTVAMDIAWVLPVVNGIDMTRAYTLLEFLEADVVIHTLNVDWPLSSTTYTYPPTTPASFVLRASIVVKDDWNIITSESISITVFKHSIT